MRRIVGLLVMVVLLVPCHPQAQGDQIISWTHDGTNVSWFELWVNGTYFDNLAVPTPVGNVYSYTVTGLPIGTYTYAIRACYGSTCVSSSTSNLTITSAGSSANTHYWVDDDGAVTTWANCKSDTALSGAGACTRATANTNAAAGQTVWFRAGTYNVSSTAISPSASGSDGSPITFRAYPGETVLFRQTSGGAANGVTIAGRDYIRIFNLDFDDFYTYGMQVYGGADHNEIAYCRFTNDTVNSFQMVTIGSNSSVATHNWLHHLYSSQTSNPSSAGCTETDDNFRIGVDARGTDYNTADYNYIEYSIHSALILSGFYTVARGNIVHNEPYHGGCATWWSLTSSTTNTIGTGSKTLTVQTGAPSLGPYIVAVDATDYNHAIYGTVTSYNSGTGALVINSQYTHGTVGRSVSSWKVVTDNSYYGPSNTVPYYDNAAYNGLVSHRNTAISDYFYSEDNYLFVEGNRFGFGGPNIGNDASTVNIWSPRNIVRYNDIYGGVLAGIFFKSTGAVQNAVYGNTIYHNAHGWWAGYGVHNGNYPRQGIAQFSSGNLIKNNLVYDNLGGEICQTSKNLNNSACSPSASDTVVNNFTSNPTFTNADLTDTLSQNLFPSVHGYAATALPDLTLQAGSGALNCAGGSDSCALTLANGSGIGSTSLTVDDSKYFQDGTRGSDLARNKTFFPDWIAVGTVSNVARISSISGNVITLATALTWSDNDPVWLYKKSDGVVVLVGTAPDYGAHEYGVGTPTAPTLGGSPNAPTNVRIR